MLIVELTIRSLTVAALLAYGSCEPLWEFLESVGHGGGGTKWETWRAKEIPQKHYWPQINTDEHR
jgi:hypothetical protein